MIIIYIELHNIYFAVDDNELFAVQYNTQSKINPNAIVLKHLDVTTGRLRVNESNQSLELDAWSLTGFIRWLRAHNPKLDTNAFGKKLFSYFAGSALISEVLDGALRTVLSERPPSGEDSFYMSKAKASHPEGFEALADAWERANPSQSGSG